MRHFRERKLLLTPYNFFVYNSNNENLRTHGEHAFYQHLVNCFQLFGLNQIILLIISAQFIIQLVRISKQKIYPGNSSKSSLSLSLKLKHKLINIYKHVINNMFSFFVLIFLAPLFVFSLISHKEARFLLPLVLPMCLLTSHLIFGKKSYRILRFAWYGFNFVSLCIFGYMHQGGMVPSINYIQKIFTHPSNLDLDQHVIFYHTYMPPRHLIQGPIAANLVSNNRYLYELRKKLSEQDIQNVLERDNSSRSPKEKIEATLHMPNRTIYDLSSSSTLFQLENLVKSIKKSYVNNRLSNQSNVMKNYAIFLVAPAIDDYELNKDERCSPEEEAYAVVDGQKKNNYNSNLKSNEKMSYQLLTKFKFHVTFEHLKEHFDLVKCKFKRSGGLSVKNMTAQEKENYSCNLEKCKSSLFLIRLLNSFSLNLYQILL